MDQVKFVEDHIASNFLKGCLPQIVLGPFFNTFTHIFLWNFFWRILDNITMTQVNNDDTAFDRHDNDSNDTFL